MKKILGMNDLLKIGSATYKVVGFKKEIKLRDVGRGNLQALSYPEFEEKLSKGQLEIIPTSK